MLAERKCLMCKHLLTNCKLWEHKCAAYPEGIPDDVYNDDNTPKDCKNDKYSFEFDNSKPSDIV